jgi:hypothetical protein
MVSENWYLSHRLERILHIADGGSKEVKSICDKSLVYSLVCLVHLIPSDGGINLAGISLSKSSLGFTACFTVSWRFWFKGIHPIHSVTPHCQIITLDHPQQSSSTGPCMRAIWKDKD